MMKSNKIIYIFVFLCILSFCAINASASSHKNQNNAIINQIKMPEASGKIICEDNGVVLDTSNTSDGYVMIKYNGESKRVKICVDSPNNTRCIYTLTSNNEYISLPLNYGSGIYNIIVCCPRDLDDSECFIIFSREINVEIKNEFCPFLYSNYSVNYNENSLAIKKANELTVHCNNDLEKVSKIYEYIIKNFSYDELKAQNTKTMCISNLDEVMETKKGICMDFASLIAAMLRSQNIPTKLHVGYVNEKCHAWISYCVENEWILLDPTYGICNQNHSIKEFKNNEYKYVTKYLY